MTLRKSTLMGACQGGRRRAVVTGTEARNAGLFGNISLVKIPLQMAQQASPSAVGRRLARSARAATRLCPMLRLGGRRSPGVHWSTFSSSPHSLKPYACVFA